MKQDILEMITIRGWNHQCSFRIDQGKIIGCDYSDLEACKYYLETGWVTLGHNISREHVIISQVMPGICC